MAEVNSSFLLNAFPGDNQEKKIRHSSSFHFASSSSSNNNNTQHAPLRLVISQNPSNLAEPSSASNPKVVLRSDTKAEVPHGKPPLGRHRKVTRVAKHQSQFYVSSGSPRPPRIRVTVPQENDSADEEQLENDGNEPIECPSLLSGKPPRKEKKRSLRSRLLRHLTGKRAAALTAGRPSRTPTGSRRKKTGSTRSVDSTNSVQSSSAESVHSVDSTPPVTKESESVIVLQIPVNENAPVDSSVPVVSHTVNSERLFINMNRFNESFLSPSHPHSFLSRSVSLGNPLSANVVNTESYHLNSNSQPNPLQSKVRFQSSLNVTLDPSGSCDMGTNSSQNLITSNHIINNESVINVPVNGNTNGSFSNSNHTFSKTSNEETDRSQRSQPSHSTGHVPKTSNANSARSLHNGRKVTSVNINGATNVNKSKQFSEDKRSNNLYHPASRRKEAPPTNTAQVHLKESPGTKSYTINLKPGIYKLNLNLPSQKKGSETHSINITVPSKNSKKPFHERVSSVPEPLYYETSKISLPQRLTHFIRSPGLCSSKSESSKSVPKVTVIQNIPNGDGSQVIKIMPSSKSEEVLNKASESVKPNKRAFIGGCPRMSYKKDRYRLAERKKAEGNEAYKNKDYKEALGHYSQAIELCPNCAAYHSNRSACYMMLGKYRDALSDARRAVHLDSEFVKGWLRVGKCHIALGDGNAALSVLQHAQHLDPNNPALIQEIATAKALQKCVEDSKKAVEKKDYRTAVFQLDQALRYALGGLDLRIAKAEYLTFLSRLTDAEDIVNDILMSDNNHADALFVRGLCRYYQDNQDAAFQHFQKVLRLVPDHTKAKDTYKRAKSLIQKKEQGNAAFKMGDFARAMEIYSEALEIDDRNNSTNSKLYCNRATVAAKLGRLEQAINDCTTAITLDDNYVKAYLRRANTYQQTEQYEEAVRDYEKVYKLQRNQEHKRMLHEAKAQLKKSKRKDYYKILGVVKSATDDEVKKAYRKKALMHHPDRHSSATAAEKAEHEKKFKELGEAYAVLTDPKKRSMHDGGMDVNDPECGFSSSGAGFDPNQVFEAFFGPDFFASSQSQQQHHYYDQHQGGGGQYAGSSYQQFPGMHSGFQFSF